MCRTLCAAFKCQRFGHTQQRCMSVNAVCGKCGSSVHDQQPCDKPPHCVNCEGDHPANDKCPTFLREREIQKIRVTEKVSFPEAKRRFQTRNPVDLSRSFSSAVKPKSPGVTASCQTHCTPTVVSHFSCQVSPGRLPRRFGVHPRWENYNSHKVQKTCPETPPDIDHLN